MSKFVYTKYHANFGTFRSDEYPKKQKRLFVFYVILLFSFCILPIFLLLSLYTVRDEIDFAPVPFFCLGICAIFVGFGCYYIHMIKKLNREYAEFLCEAEEQRKLEEEYKKEHPYLEAEEFFKQAREAGIPDLDSKANVSRLFLFAKNNGITSSHDEIIKQYNLGKQYVEPYETEERLRELRDQEDILQEQYERYANYTEQDKSIQICLDKISEAENIIYQCEQDESSVRNGGEATYMLGRQKESSWAIHGGIANGIAGGAAGLAVAADTERRNQEKRQFNAELSKNIATLIVMQLEQIWDRKRSAERDLKYWTYELEEAKFLLCEKLNQNELLDMLHPSMEEVEITETGAVKFKVNLHSTPNLIIFDEIKAVVDGSIRVLLKVNDEVVDVAICVLPYGGMSKGVTLEGICCNPTVKAHEYTFDFAPNCLWAVETKKTVYDSREHE